MKELIFGQMGLTILMIAAHFGCFLYGVKNQFCEFIKYAGAFGAFGWAGYLTILLARMMKIL